MDNDYRTQLNQVGWGLCSTAILVVGARCYCRYWVIRSFGYDDVFMVLALASGISMSALVTAGVHHGYGLHLEDITNPYDQERALMYTFVAPCVSIVASTFGKISTVLLLIRLLGHSAKRRHMWFLYSTVVVMIFLNLFAISLLLGGCRPMEKSWKPTLPGTCINTDWYKYVGRVQSIWNALTDLVTAGFPVYMVWRLQMKRSTKWGLSSVMAGGIFAAAATFVKVYYMRDLTKLTDVTYAWAPISIWYMAEVFALLIAGSLPTLKPIWSLIRRYVPIAGLTSIFSSRRYAKGSFSSGGDGIRTVGSKPTKVRRHRGVGSITVALDEIDNMTRREASCSTDSILATSRQPLERREVSSAQDSRRSLETVEQRPAHENGIHVQQGFSIDYAECSESDTKAFEKTKLPEHPQIRTNI